MTYAARQQAGQCQRCDDDATDGQYCAEHAEAQRDYLRRCVAQRRELRREMGYCAECPAGVFTPSVTYRCPACERKRKPSSEALPLRR